MLEIVRKDKQKIILRDTDNNLLGFVSVSVKWKKQGSGLYVPVALTEWNVSSDIKIIRHEIDGKKTDGNTSNGNS